MDRETAVSHSREEGTDTVGLPCGSPAEAGRKTAAAVGVHHSQRTLWMPLRDSWMMKRF